MSYLSLRAAVIVPIMALVLVSVTPVASTAAPPRSAEDGRTPGQPEDIPREYLDLEEPQAEYGDLEVEWYAGTYMVSPEEAEERLRLADELGELQTRIMGAHPDTFGGMWIDNDHGGIVHVAHTARGERVIEELARDFSRPDLIVAHQVRYSEQELDALLDRVVGFRDRHWAGTPDDPSGFSAPYTVWVDVPGNRVVIEGPGDHPGVLAEVDAALQVVDHPAVVFENGSPVERFCAVTDCRWHFRGGVRLVRNADTSLGNRYCASGFQVHARGTSIPGTLTAGHCDGYINDIAWNGGVIQSRLRGRLVHENIDAQWLRYEIGAPWQVTRWVRRDHSRQAWQIHHNTNLWSSTKVGDTICVTGQYAANSNTTCGRVQTRNAAGAHVPNGKQFIELRRGSSSENNSLCVRPTDSGGPAWRGSTAIGLIQGGTPPEFIPCWDPGYRVYIGHIQFVQERLLVDVECGPVTSTCIRR